MSHYLSETEQDVLAIATTAAFAWNASNEAYEFVGFNLSQREVLDRTGSTDIVTAPLSRGQRKRIQDLIDAGNILNADLTLNANHQLRILGR